MQPSKDVKTPLRAAYHGHLTQLAAKLQASKHGLLQATLDMNRDWQSFKTSYLDKQLHLEDRNSWEVELPTVQNGPDELTDPGSCQMDVYSQADFDNTEVCSLNCTLPSSLAKVTMPQSPGSIQSIICFVLDLSVCSSAAL